PPGPKTAPDREASGLAAATKARGGLDELGAVRRGGGGCFGVLVAARRSGAAAGGGPPAVRKRPRTARPPDSQRQLRREEVWTNWGRSARGEEDVLECSLRFVGAGPLRVGDHPRSENGPGPRGLRTRSGN